MNLLINKLPESVLIGNRAYKINTDFRIGVQFEELLTDRNLTDEELTNKSLILYYPILSMKIDNNSPEEIKQYYNIFIENIVEAIKKMHWFYRCGKEIKPSTESKKNTGDVFSFEHDSEYLYAAFKEQYNVDLYTDNLHWWSFKSMFAGLNDSNKLMKIMSIRGMDLTGLKGKELEHYKKMKKAYELPHDEEEMSANDRLNELLNSGGSLSDL